MKKTLKQLALITILSVFTFACDSKNEKDEGTKNNNEQTNVEESNEVSDLLNLITKSGNLLEIKTYDVGRFRNIKFQVKKITDINSSEVSTFANIEINYEDRFYYYTEDALIVQREIQDFINALEIIKNNYTNTTMDTETIAGYISSGGVRIRAIYRNNRWRYEFHVNHRKNDAGVSFTQSDFDTLIALFRETDEKINELNN